MKAGAIRGPSTAPSAPGSARLRAVPVLLLAATSKLPFFLVGGALAAWAVVLALIGLRNPDFPYNVRGQFGVIAITFLIVVGTVAAAISTA
jgi:hypothetical protein